jgi:hypothetical protein
MIWTKMNNMMKKLHMSFLTNSHPDSYQRGVEKDHFNRKALKVVAKDAKLKHCKSALCDLGEIPIAIGTWRPLRLMDFDFFNTPHGWVKHNQEIKSKLYKSIP